LASLVAWAVTTSVAFIALSARLVPSFSRSAMPASILERFDGERPCASRDFWRG